MSNIELVMLVTYCRPVQRFQERGARHPSCCDIQLKIRYMPPSFIIEHMITSWIARFSWCQNKIPRENCSVEELL